MGYRKEEICISDKNRICGLCIAMRGESDLGQTEIHVSQQRVLHGNDIVEMNAENI